ncbi:MAG: hypothetical protein A2Z34_06510 [Planctomycetes bacterium RBG_16_59_8]|nr:MAG: hypothetical protein A2Z34_06510 [Planctomycetes bacterium RBG_16_59_8]
MTRKISLETVLIFLIASGILFADAIPTTTTAGTPAASSGSSAAPAPSDVDFFSANPDALRIAGQTNTWYENAGGVAWIVVTVAAIAIMVAMT